jgi:uncharacterized protein YegL
MVRIVVLALVWGVVCAASSISGPASSQQAITAQVNAVDTSSYPAIQATVTVLDDTLRPVTGLPPEAFAADVAGEPVPVTSVGSGTDPGLGIAVVLTFDVSGSMAGAPLAAAKDAGKALIAQLGPQDQVAILAFSDGVSQPVAFTQDRVVATSAIDALVAAGNTALYQAVAESASVAASATLPREAVVLLSDGLDFGGVSQVDRGASLTAAAGSGAPFIAVGLGAEIDQAYLQELADVTRGSLLLAPTPGSLTELYAGIGAALRQQYVLTLDGTSVPAGTTGALRITVTSGGATATAETPLSVPAIETPPPSDAPSTTSSVVTPAENGGGSGLPILAGGVGLGFLVLAGVGGLFVWRRRSSAEAGAEIDYRRVQEQPTAPLFPAVEAVVAPESTAYLQIAGESEKHPLGEAPVTVGFTSDCTVHLPEGMGTGNERVRIWRREGRFMLHTLSRIGIVRVADRAVSWAILEDGDVLQVGLVRLEFHDESEPLGR